MLKKLITIILSIGAMAGAGLAVASVTIGSNYNTWYDKLVKPEFHPGDWFFEQAWVVLFALLGIALAIIILRVTDNKAATYIRFAAQFILTITWPMALFGAHQLWPAAAIATALVISTLMTIMILKKSAPSAAWALMPNLAWALFAAYVSIYAAVLN